MGRLLFLLRGRSLGKPSVPSSGSQDTTDEIDIGLALLVMRFGKLADANKPLARQVLEIGDWVLRFYGW